MNYPRLSIAVSGFLECCCVFVMLSSYSYVASLGPPFRTPKWQRAVLAGTRSMQQGGAAGRTFYKIEEELWHICSVLFL